MIHNGVDVSVKLRGSRNNKTPLAEQYVFRERKRERELRGARNTLIHLVTNFVRSLLKKKRGGKIQNATITSRCMHRHYYYAVNLIITIRPARSLARFVFKQVRMKF